MKTFGTGDVVDVVVVGTGAGGAPVMATLAEAGLSVVALEAGRWWDPATEYAADEVKMSELYWLDERHQRGRDADGRLEGITAEPAWADPCCTGARTLRVRTSAT